MEIILAFIAIVVVFSSTALLMIRRGYLPSPKVIKDKNTKRSETQLEKVSGKEFGVENTSFVPNFLKPNTKTYAFVIGADNYASPSLPKLSFIKNDVERIADILSSHYSLEKLTLITGEKAKKENILFEIKNALRNITSNDNILLYFAGHGFYKKTSGKGLTYFGTYDTDPEQLENTAISSRVFQEILSNKIADKMLFILDACYPENILEQLQSDEYTDFSQLFTIQSDRAIITSRFLQEIKPRSKSNYQHLFTKYLIEGLSEGVTSKSRYIRIRDLYYYISGKLDEQDLDYKPILQSTSGENFPLLLKKTGDEK